ncbi:hypothetical protein ITP53_44195 [Nonomuraea sp. K274]|uniref:Uncharacterized protein n=1 Tax=Nonomuraea cypriaca TaxID=1187855 RepID=A0A931ALG9_9ACTN|nr:DUF6300 family protein [Nonomuraea cypriaca]MBF8192569.1 hypothetical protein [Nonomuraea cypriaca]
MSGGRQVDVLTTGEPPTCPRCEGDGLLSALVPYGWANAAGDPVDGRTGVVLCATCDASAPHAAPLITWFRVHGHVADQRGKEFVRLLVAWAGSVSVSPLDERTLDEEIGQWRNGSL